MPVVTRSQQKLLNFENKDNNKIFWNWFKKMVNTYLTNIQECIKLRFKVKNENHKYIEIYFNELRLIIELIHNINTYYPEFNNIEIFGKSVYKKIVDLYKQIPLGYNKIEGNVIKCSLTQLEKGEELQIIKIIFQEFIDTEFIIGNLVSIEKETYKQLQEAKNTFIKYIIDCENNVTTTKDLHYGII